MDSLVIKNDFLFSRTLSFIITAIDAKKSVRATRSARKSGKGKGSFRGKRSTRKSKNSKRTKSSFRGNRSVRKGRSKSMRSKRSVRGKAKANRKEKAKPKANGKGKSSMKDKLEMMKRRKDALRRLEEEHARRRKVLILRSLGGVGALLFMFSIIYFVYKRRYTNDLRKIINEDLPMKNIQSFDNWNNYYDLNRVAPLQEINICKDTFLGRDYDTQKIFNWQFDLYSTFNFAATTNTQYNPTKKLIDIFHHIKLGDEVRNSLIPSFRKNKLYKNGLKFSGFKTQLREITNRKLLNVQDYEPQVAPINTNTGAYNEDPKLLPAKRRVKAFNWNKDESHKEAGMEAHTARVISLLKQGELFHGVDIKDNDYKWKNEKSDVCLLEKFEDHLRSIQFYFYNRSTSLIDLLPESQNIVNLTSKKKFIHKKLLYDVQKKTRQEIKKELDGCISSHISWLKNLCGWYSSGHKDIEEYLDKRKIPITRVIEMELGESMKSYDPSKALESAKDSVTAVNVLCRPDTLFFEDESKKKNNDESFISYVGKLNQYLYKNITHELTSWGCKLWVMCMIIEIKVATSLLDLLGAKYRLESLDEVTEESLEKKNISTVYLKNHEITKFTDIPRRRRNGKQYPRWESFLYLNGCINDDNKTEDELKETEKILKKLWQNSFHMLHLKDNCQKLLLDLLHCLKLCNLKVCKEGYQGEEIKREPHEYVYKKKIYREWPYGSKNAPKIYNNIYKNRDDFKRRYPTKQIKDEPNLNDISWMADKFLRFNTNINDYNKPWAQVEYSNVLDQIKFGDIDMRRLYKMQTHIEYYDHSMTFSKRRFSCVPNLVDFVLPQSHQWNADEDALLRNSIHSDAFYKGNYIEKFEDKKRKLLFGHLFANDTNKFYTNFKEHMGQAGYNDAKGDHPFSYVNVTNADKDWNSLKIRNEITYDTISSQLPEIHKVDGLMERCETLGYANKYNNHSIKGGFIDENTIKPLKRFLGDPEFHYYRLKDIPALHHRLINSEELPTTKMDSRLLLFGVLADNMRPYIIFQKCIDTYLKNIGSTRLVESKKSLLLHDAFALPFLFNTTLDKTSIGSHFGHTSVGENGFVKKEPISKDSYHVAWHNVIEQNCGRWRHVPGQDENTLIQVHDNDMLDRKIAHPDRKRILLDLDPFFLLQSVEPFWLENSDTNSCPNFFTNVMMPFKMIDNTESETQINWDEVHSDSSNLWWLTRQDPRMLFRYYSDIALYSPTFVVKPRELNLIENKNLEGCLQNDKFYAVFRDKIAKHCTNDQLEYPANLANRHFWKLRHGHSISGANDLGWMLWRNLEPQYTVDGFSSANATAAEAEILNPGSQTGNMVGNYYCYMNYNFLQPENYVSNYEAENTDADWDKVKWIWVDYDKNSEKHPERDPIVKIYRDHVKRINKVIMDPHKYGKLEQKTFFEEETVTNEDNSNELNLLRCGGFHSNPYKLLSRYIMSQDKEKQTKLSQGLEFDIKPAQILEFKKKEDEGQEIKKNIIGQGYSTAKTEVFEKDIWNIFPVMRESNS